MLRDDASLRDIYQAGQNIVKFSEGLTKADLELDDAQTSAILFQIIIVGEATKRLSPEFRLQHPDLPWTQMAGMRDIVAHQYDKIDFNVMWDVIRRNIPEMLNEIEPLMPI